MCILGSPAAKRLWMRRLVAFLALSLLLVVLGGTFVAITNAWILRQSRARIVPRLADVPKNDVALVLGTSPRGPGGWANPFFEGRMDTAATLYRSSKVKHLLVSGDNGRKTYDEPTAMRDALIQRGVPAEAITLDYAGFRTLDTMARARTVFGLTRCTVVTDDFHLARCLFLARAHGIDATGVPSPSVPWRWSKKTRLREIGSRTAAWLDVFLFRTRPKFYGPPVEITIADEAEAVRSRERSGPR